MLAIFLDLETTGLNAFLHRVLEIAFKIVDIHTGEVLLTYHKGVRQSLTVWEQRDPASVQFNGFTWERNLEGQDEESIGREITGIFTEYRIQRGKAVFICQNPSFDRGFFSQLVDVYLQEKHRWPYHWLDFASMFWALSVRRSNSELPFPREIDLSKNAIAALFGIPKEAEPHSAINGVNHLLSCYEKVVGFA